MDKRARKVAKAYADLVRKKKLLPSQRDLFSAGFSNTVVYKSFRNLQEVKRAAKKLYPKAFRHVLDEDDFSGLDYYERMQKLLGRQRRFVITTAVTGCQVNKKFLGSLENYCRERSALLVVLPCTDPAAKGEWTLDAELHDAGAVIIPRDMPINSNIFLSTIKLGAKQINPITGLSRIGQRRGSFIYASPKQMMEPVAISTKGLVHVLMTTGAVTDPNYDPDPEKPHRYLSQRTAYIAHNDHVLGAIVLEVEDEKIYHFRQLQADPKSGSVVDLGVQYTPKSTKKVRPEAFVPGDLHVTETDPVVEKAWFDVIKLTQPKRVFFHDMFSGVSINHHEQNQHIRLAQLAEEKKLCLADEIAAVARKMEEWGSKVDQVNVVKSNHDEFLSRYLEESRYVNDPQNKKISLQLALAMIDGEDPLRYAVEKLFGMKRKNVRWLTRNDECKIAGIELANHGDMGPNGARGSLAGMEKAYGNSVSGHAHTPRIFRGAWQVGTSSYLKLSYNEGPSSWMHSACLVYKNGSRQLINVIDGKWRLEDKDAKKPR